MKSVITSLTLLFLTITAIAQTPDAVSKPVLRTIEVTGSAEMEIEPDEVYLSVNLREYMKDKVKVNLADIDKEFKKVLSDARIDLNNVSVQGANAYYDYEYWRNRSQKTDFLASKTYTIKLPDLAKYNELMQKMSNKGIENAWLLRTDHSKIEAYREQVKINALKAAKTKAKGMVESIGSQLGEVVFIRELNNDNMYRPVMYKAMSNVAEDASMGGGAEQGIQMEKIKIRYEVEAHFMIK